MLYCSCARCLAYYGTHKSCAQNGACTSTCLSIQGLHLACTYTCVHRSFISITWCSNWQIHTVHRGTLILGGLQNRKTATFPLKYQNSHWSSSKIPSITLNTIRKLPSPKYRTKLEFLPNTATQNARKTTYRHTGRNRNTTVFDWKYHKTVRKMAQNRNTTNPYVPSLSPECLMGC